MTDASDQTDGLAKFLAGDANSFFAHPAELPITAPLGPDSIEIPTSPAPSSDDSFQRPQHASPAQVAERRLNLDAPTADDRIHSSARTSRPLFPVAALSLAAFAILGLGGVAVLQIGDLRPLAITTPPVAAEEGKSAVSTDPLAPTGTMDEAHRWPPTSTAEPVHEVTNRAELDRWWATLTPSAELRKFTIHPVAPSSQRRLRPHRRFTSKVSKTRDNIDTLTPSVAPAARIVEPSPAMGCPPSLSTACPR